MTQAEPEAVVALALTVALVAIAAVLYLALVP